MAKKILIVLTSQGEMKSASGETQPTGWYLTELSHPFDVFQAAGYDLTFASPKGGEAPLDPSSVEGNKSDASAMAFVSQQKSLWQNTKKLSDVRAADFDALFFPGGHGPMIDLAVDAESQRLIAEFYTAGKPVAAVCHGPAVLVNVKLPSGEHILGGKTVTGFSDAEEEAVDKVKFMPFSLEGKLKENAKSYVKADQPWGAKVVVDGKLATGQNPASAKGLAEEVVKLLS